MDNNFFNDEQENEYEEEEEEELEQYLLPELRVTLMNENEYIENYSEQENEYEEEEEEEQEEPMIFDSSFNNLLNVMWIPPQNFNLNNFSFFNNHIEPSSSLDGILSSSFENDTDVYKNVLSDEGYKQLKVIKYNSSLVKESVCPITREEFKEDEEVIQLPCQHVFNKEAIKTWLEKECAICPICRKELKSKEIKNEDNISETSQEIENISSSNLTHALLNVINDRYRQLEEEELQQAIMDSFND
jgi:hypothetical protein